MDSAERDQYRTKLINESYHYQSEHSPHKIAYSQSRRKLTQAITEVIMIGMEERDRGLIQMAVHTLMLNAELLDYPFGQSELRRILEQDITLD